jgi:hypothetical protein
MHPQDDAIGIKHRRQNPRDLAEDLGVGSMPVEYCDQGLESNKSSPNGRAIRKLTDVLLMPLDQTSDEDEDPPAMNDEEMMSLEHARMSDPHYSTTPMTSWSIPEYMISRVHSVGGAEYKHALRIATRPPPLQPVVALMLMEAQNKQPVALNIVKPYILSPTKPPDVASKSNMPFNNHTLGY